MSEARLRTAFRNSTTRYLSDRVARDSERRPAAIRFAPPPPTVAWFSGTQAVVRVMPPVPTPRRRQERAAQDTRLTCCSSVARVARARSPSAIPARAATMPAPSRRYLSFEANLLRFCAFQRRRHGGEGAGRSPTAAAPPRFCGVWRRHARRDRLRVSVSRGKREFEPHRSAPSPIITGRDDVAHQVKAQSR